MGAVCHLITTPCNCSTIPHHKGKDGARISARMPQLVVFGLDSTTHSESVKGRGKCGSKNTFDYRGLVYHQDQSHEQTHQYVTRAYLCTFREQPGCLGRPKVRCVTLFLSCMHFCSKQVIISQWKPQSTDSLSRPMSFSYMVHRPPKWGHEDCKNGQPGAIRHSNYFSEPDLSALNTYSVFHHLSAIQVLSFKLIHRSLSL